MTAHSAVATDLRRRYACLYSFAADTAAATATNPRETIARRFGKVPRVRLPNAKKAIVERGKIADYLLDAAHPDNGGKAAFFESLGFHRVEPEVLATALQNLAREAEVAQASVSPHGRKYVIVGQIESPIGKAASVQTIWIVDKGSDVARLVTAYPRKV